MRRDDKLAQSKKSSKIPFRGLIFKPIETPVPMARFRSQRDGKTSASGTSSHAFPKCRMCPRGVAMGPRAQATRPPQVLPDSARRTGLSRICPGGPSQPEGCRPFRPGASDASGRQVEKRPRARSRRRRRP